MRACIVFAVMYLCAQTPTSAQVRVIPEELALSLLADREESSSMQNFKILVGKAPDSTRLPTVDLPVIGSAQQGNATTIVYRVAGPLGATQRRAEAEYRAAGWRTPPGGEREEIGFVATYGGNFMFMCRGDDLLVMQTVTIRPDLRILKVSLYHRPGCQAGWTQHSADLETPLPRLEPPKGAEIRSYGMDMPGVVSTFVSNAFITSNLTTAAIMDHYGTQMRAKGWSSRGFTKGELTAVQTWRIAQDGKEWLASLAATQLPERHHVLEITVYSLTDLTR